MPHSNALHINKNDVLLCNAGSSSLKILARQIGPAENSYANIVHFDGDAKRLASALENALQGQTPPRAVMHRIVHAGAVTEHAQRMDAATVQRIRHWSVLAPLHNPLALSLFDIIGSVWPQVSQYAVYDSGLYSDLPDEAARYPLPDSLSIQWPVRRYGFHGLAHRHQWRSVHAAARQVGEAIPQRFISIHLGGGCSMSAWQGDSVIDTSMGFTPLEGMMMSTRSGNVDPGLLLHLLQQENLSSAQLSQTLTKSSGLAALAPGNGDMRELLASHCAEAQQAVTQYCYQVRKQLGAYIAALGGVDAISIGGGVGENQAAIRERIFMPLQGLGIILDRQRNRQAKGVSALQKAHTQTTIWLTPVNEMEEMLRQYKAMESQSPRGSNE